MFVHVAGITRNNYKIQTARPRGLTELNTEGSRVSSHTLWQLQRRVFQQVPRPTAIAFSGSLPPGAPPTIYQRWIRVVRRRGALPVLDASGHALRLGTACGAATALTPGTELCHRQDVERIVRRVTMRRAA